VWPITVSWVLALAIGIYQGTVDITFVNGGAYLLLRRAAGGMKDANLFGVSVALWGPFVYMLCGRWRTRWTQPLGVAALALSWYGMWVSGSRNAFLTAILGVIAVATAEIRALDARRRVWTLGLFAVALVAVVIVGYRIPTENSPVHRLAPMFSGMTEMPLGALLVDRWDPYFFGRTAWRAFQDSPVFGIGLGMFHSLVGPYSQMLGHDPLPSDNAQNWFRHQLTEMGVVGSIPWAMWVCCAAVLIVSPARDRYRAWLAKGALLTCGAFSLIGMPGQSIVIVVLFWTIAFVVTQQVTPRWPRVLVTVINRPALACLLAVVCVIGTAVAGRTMTPVQRASRFRERYGAGVAEFSETEGRGEFSIHGRRAMTVIEPTSRLLKVSAVRIADGAPVDVQISVNRRMLSAGPVSRSERVGFVTLRDLSTFAIVDVSSAVSLPEPDGLSIRWEFVPQGQ
jgi:hypothetical protein